MGNTDANLGIKITAKDDGSVVLEKMAKSLKSVSVSAKQMQADVQNMGSAVARVGAQVNAAFGAVGVSVGLAGFVSLVRASVDEAQQAERATLKLESVLRSTGGAAGYSSTELKNFADDIERMTGIENDQVISAEAMMATFTRIGGKTFKDAMVSAADLSAVMGQDLKSSVVQVGKALQDPIAGATALRRVGVALTEQQQEQIKKFMEAGDLYSAQKIILQELQTEFGNAAAAMQGPLSRAISEVKLSWKDLKKEIGDTDAFKTALGALSDLIRKGTELTKWSKDSQKIMDLNMISAAASMLKQEYESYSRIAKEQEALGLPVPAANNRKAAADSLLQWQQMYAEYANRATEGLEIPRWKEPKKGAGGAGAGILSEDEKFKKRLKDPTYAAEGEAWAKGLAGGVNDLETMVAIDKLLDEQFKKACEAARPEGEAIAKALGDGFNAMDWLAMEEQVRQIHWKQAFEQALPAARDEGEAIGLALSEGTKEQIDKMLTEQKANIENARKYLESVERPKRNALEETGIGAVHAYFSGDADKAYEDRKKRIEDAFQTLRDKNLATVEDEKKKNDSLKKLDEDYSRSRKETLSASLDITASFAGNAAELMLKMYERSAGHGKKYWEWYKSLAAAEIVASSASAIIKSWSGYASFGWVGTAAAIAQDALIAASAAIQLSNLNSQQPRTFALGGIVNRPTYGMIGEAGPEAVLPLNRLNGVVPAQPANNNIIVKVNMGGIHGGIDPTVLSVVKKEVSMVTTASVQAALYGDRGVARRIREIARS